MTQGKIIKGIAGFYYVHIENGTIFECKAKGSFRKENKKPLVGDQVFISITDAEKKTGIVEQILPRKNELIRPASANVDQALVIFAVKQPEPNFNLLDRFLIMMQQLEIPTIICFNKMDLFQTNEKEEILSVYQKAGSRIVFCSATQKDGLEELVGILQGKTTVVAGPSGVGKSSLINTLQSSIQMETGVISQKIDRGKHTTRHCELIAINENSYIMDTPGFSSLHMFSLEKEELGFFYKEFVPYENECRFQGCSHIHEPNCSVKEALEKEEISKVRYHNYVTLYEELKEKRKY